MSRIPESLPGAAKVPVLEPSDSQNAGFPKPSGSVKSMYSVIVRLTTRVAHSQGLVELGERDDIPIKPIQRSGKYVMMPAMAKGAMLW